MQALEPGTKVEYMAGGEWKLGVVHGYRQYETEAGIVKGVTYLIDTGEDERVDEYPFDHREREISRQMNDHMKKHNSTVPEAFQAVTKKNDLPESKLDVERVRQPKQLEVSQQFVKPVR